MGRRIPDNIEASLGKREEDHGMPPAIKTTPATRPRSRAPSATCTRTTFSPSGGRCMPTSSPSAIPTCGLRYMQYLDGAMRKISPWTGGTVTWTLPSGKNS